MDYEKKYKDALEKAKEVYNRKDATDGGKLILESMFPELKESEDKKIRKEILYYLSERRIVERLTDTKVKEDWIAWLEKQGEQKPIISNNALREGIAHFGITQYQIDNWLKKYVDIEKQSEQKPYNTETKFKVGDKVLWKYNKSVVKTITKVSDNGKSYWIEGQGCGSGWWSEQELESYINKDEQKSTDKVKPKFKVGDWITNSIETVQITNYDIDYGYQVDYKGNLQNRDTDIIEKEYHLWTIQDAKDGDVLYSPYHNLLWIYKDEKTCYVGSNLNYNYGSILIDKLICIPIDVKPATKEQCDFLFQKMHEAGYEWDANKKVLKKIK